LSKAAMVDRPAPPAKAEEKIHGGRIQPTAPLLSSEKLAAPTLRTAQ
jgi:hypothetical protein